jgi:hypothetical protein
MDTHWKCMQKKKRPRKTPDSAGPGRPSLSFPAKTCFGAKKGKKNARRRHPAGRARADVGQTSPHSSLAYTRRGCHRRVGHPLPGRSRQCGGRAHSAGRGRAQRRRRRTRSPRRSHCAVGPQAPLPLVSRVLSPAASSNRRVASAKCGKKPDLHLAVKPLRRSFLGSAGRAAFQRLALPPLSSSPRRRPPSLPSPRAPSHPAPPLSPPWRPPLRPPSLFLSPTSAPALLPPLACAPIRQPPLPLLDASGDGEHHARDAFLRARLGRR